MHPSLSLYPPLPALFFAGLRCPRSRRRHQRLPRRLWQRQQQQQQRRLGVLLCDEGGGQGGIVTEDPQEGTEKKAVTRRRSEPKWRKILKMLDNSLLPFSTSSLVSASLSLPQVSNQLPIPNNNVLRNSNLPHCCFLAPLQIMSPSLKLKSLQGSDVLVCQCWSYGGKPIFVYWNPLTMHP